MEEIMTAIQTVGVPTAFALMTMFFLREESAKHDEQINKLIEQHANESRGFQQAMEELNVTMGKLLEHIRGDETNG